MASAAAWSLGTIFVFSFEKDVVRKMGKKMSQRGSVNG